MPSTASVVIDNCNYARFLRDAIDSALRQTRPAMEVIVVDDGSTDDSREVIASYGQRVRPVFKENGGMASALNSGCRLARGDVVLLLDSDDVLGPDAVDRVLAAWEPETVLIQARLRIIDEAGTPTRGTVPGRRRRLDEGDLRGRMLATGGYTAVVTSGLALRRDALLRVLPIPEDRFRQGADGYLVRAIAFLGRVQAIDEPLGYYRIHGGNWTALGATPARMGTSLRRSLDFFRNEFDVVRSRARLHGLEAAPDVGEGDADYLLLRLSSLVADPENHPIPTDSRVRLLLRVAAALWRARSLPGRRWSAAMGLAVAVTFLPRRMGFRILVWWYDSSARPAWLDRCLDLYRAMPAR